MEAVEAGVEARGGGRAAKALWAFWEDTLHDEGDVVLDDAREHDESNMQCR